MVEDHQHLTELLRACDPALRRDMYEALRPNLRFPARPLEDYIIAAKAHAEAAELPVMDEQGFLHPYSAGSVGTIPTIEIPTMELRAVCGKCGKEAIFFGADKGDAIFVMRASGWAFDETVNQKHLCVECLDAVTD